MANKRSKGVQFAHVRSYVCVRVLARARIERNGPESCWRARSPRSPRLAPLRRRRRYLPQPPSPPPPPGKPSFVDCDEFCDFNAT